MSVVLIKLSCCIYANKKSRQKKDKKAEEVACISKFPPPITAPGTGKTAIPAWMVVSYSRVLRAAK